MMKHCEKSGRKTSALKRGVEEQDEDSYWSEWGRVVMGDEAARQDGRELFRSCSVGVMIECRRVRATAPTGAF